MDAQEKEHIMLMLRKIAKEVNQYLLSQENEADSENEINSVYYSNSFFLSHFDEEREAILVKVLNDPTYAAKFSEEFLEKLLKKELQAMFDGLKQQKYSPKVIAKNTAAAVFHELDSYTTNLTVYLPISGIDLLLEEGQLEIGNITFQKMAQHVIDEIINHFIATIKVMRYSDEEKEQLIAFYTKDINQRFQEKENQTYAIYRIIAEPIQAERRAKEACYEVFDLLRYALPRISSLYPMGFYIPVEYMDNRVRETNTYAQRERPMQTMTDKHVSFGYKMKSGFTRRILVIPLFYGTRLVSIGIARGKNTLILYL